MPFVFQKNWRERDESPAQQRVLEIKDRERPGRIRCRVLVAREETRSDWSATIKLSYVSLDACGSGFGNHAFTGKWERFPGGEQKVSVTGGNLMLYGDGIPRGAHIGTYLLDEVVRWARQWPAAQVRQISLSSVDGGDDNRERRNQLYEQFGIRFRYSEDRKSGVSVTPMSAAELTPVAPSVWDQDIAEIGALEYMRASKSALEMEGARVHALESDLQEHREQLAQAQGMPLRWMCRRVWIMYQKWIYLIFFVTAISAMLWGQLSK
ncbi:hypothetical protein [Achromobacter insolitus]|uniref:hypothetical protein n=1 Tax=Achromobacter insolitus TaxID=217204 RepID=UPI0007C3C00A|nr:hypothetical protein [Achromobacter insolitus]OAD16486.1 hypothetical protein A3839_28465 [Achromobacter insolitus]